MADPDHPDHAETKEWLGDYDPEMVDEASIKCALGRIVNQGRDAKGRTREKKSA